MRSTICILGALAIAQTALALPMPQIGGDAQAAYYILNNVDNGSGYAIENVEDNVADLYDGQPTGSDSEGSGNGGPPPRRLRLRQLNKVVAGLATVGQATGTSLVTTPIVNTGDDVDTIGTNDQGELGEEVGSVEDPGLPELANDATNLDPNGTLPPLDQVPSSGAAPPAKPAGFR